MEICEAVFKRRSVRKFLPQAVEREKLEEVLRAGAFAPSAMNDQSRQFIAIIDKNVLGELNRAVESASDEATRARIRNRSTDGRFNFFYNAPVLIAVCDSPDAYRPAEDCACALENMFLSAFGLSLGSCWINQLTGLDGNTPAGEILSRAGMKEGYRVYGCCALGYADGKTEISKPKTNEIIIL